MSGNQIHRRRFLTGAAASGLLGLGSTGVAGQPQSSNARVRPSTESLTVQPGTQLMFEVDPSASSSDSYPEWYIDGEAQAPIVDQWTSPYTDEVGTMYWLHEVGSDCQVTADFAPDTEGGTSTTWNLETAQSGVAPPEIQEARPSTDERRDLEDGRSFECELDVADPNGNLDRVVWWALALDVVIDVSDISGSEDTARIAPDASDIVPEGVLAWVVTENGAYIGSDIWKFNFASDDPTFEVSNVHNNSPIGGGETLDVTATVENTGDQTGQTDVDLIVGHSPELVDTTSLELTPGSSSDVNLEFEAGQPAGGREEFPGKVETSDDTAEFPIIVDDSETAPAEFSVTEMSTNSPINGGEMLEVETTIENIGGETGRTDIELVVGHSPKVEDRVMRTLDPGESSTFTLTFQAGQPSGEVEEFPVTVDTGADTATRNVAVEAATPATFNVTGMSTNSPVNSGETLEVETTIENVGDETGRTDIELVVGHDPAVEDSVMRTLDPGESSTFTLTFDTGQPSGEVEEFPVVVDTGADTATRNVAVEATTPATFNVMSMSTNSPIGGGETLTVETTIQNVGDETGRTDIELVVGHSPKVEDSVMRTLDPGESSTFTLTFQSGQPTGGREAFPVVVDTGADTSTQTVVVAN